MNNHIPGWAQLIQGLKEPAAIDKLVAHYDENKLAEILVDLWRNPPNRHVVSEGFVRGHLLTGTQVWLSPFDLEDIGIVLTNDVPAGTYVVRDQYNAYWFWDENGQQACGPYGDITSVEDALTKYADTLEQ